MKTAEMMTTYLGATDRDRDLLARTVDALTECAQACTACADACLDEQMVADLRRWIHSNLDCADICATTARVLSRHAGYDVDVTHSVPVQAGANVALVAPSPVHGQSSRSEDRR